MKTTILRNLIFVLSLTLVGVACSDSSTGDNNNQETAHVKGRVDNTSSSSQKAKLKQVEGAVVTAAKVKANGELETVGNAEATTNAEGEFTLDINASAIGNAGNNIIIVAENNGETGKAFVASKVESGTIVNVQPITFESTAEASVYQKDVENGDTDEVSKADIELTVNAKVAADIESNASDAAKVESALKAQADTKAEYYSENNVDISSDQNDQIANAKMDALVQLESQLSATTDSQTAEDDFDTFVEAMGKAETDAGIDASDVAMSSEASAKVLVSKSSDLSDEAQAELRQQSAATLTFALNAAVKAQLEAAGASQATIDASSQAAADLRASLNGMENATEANIKSAFSNFNDAIETEVKNDSELKGSLFASVNTSINANGGAKSTFTSSLQSSLQGSVDMSGMMDAYTQFHSDVMSAVNTTFADASDAEVQAYTKLLVLINLSS